MQTKHMLPKKLAEGDTSLKEIMEYLKQWWLFLLSKWLIIIVASIFGGMIGIIISITTKPKYTASLSFVLEEDKSSGAGLPGAFGLASSLGLDIGGSGGGAFSNSNIMELMKSRTLVQKALLYPVTDGNHEESLAAYYLRLNGLDNKLKKKFSPLSFQFLPMADASKFSRFQDSIIGAIYNDILENDNQLSISQRDKKISIMIIEVKSVDEAFSKVFAEALAKVVSNFYIETKSKKARDNYQILQKQTDSIRTELGQALTGVTTANDNTFNLNPALNVQRLPSMRKQIDVQTNTAILSQLVTNLELAKVSLRKETPLIQIIDKPTYPLKKEQLGKFATMIKGILIAGVMMVFVLVIRKLLTE